MKPMTLLFNEDAVTGARRHISDGAVDLILTDPPYGIAGDTLHRHYHRKEEFVVDGYVEVPQAQYAHFSRAWVRQAERILRPGGSLYVMSGYSNLRDILNALAETELALVNHLIWKYNFGVYTTNKYVSSHYHLLYCVKPGRRPTFNTYCRFGPSDKNADGGAANYLDREDVWIINREYKPGRRKNKNELPTELLKKVILYSSNPGDLVCDLFLGGFSTARVAVGLGRRIVGFELSKSAFRHGVQSMKEVAPGSLLRLLPPVAENGHANRGRRWTPEERARLLARYAELRRRGETKRGSIDILSEEFGRGYFALLNVIDAHARS
ncbi:site-specific DNA-methyltransferase [bacterium]|nr:site-specific DNA-methyltransferase [bacterium]